MNSHMKRNKSVKSFSMHLIFILIGIVELILLLALSPSRSFSLTSDLVINEIMVSNISYMRDPDYNNFSGWIEIYNTGGSTINLNGYTLTDDMTEPDKWVIGDVSIDPGNFLIFWTDNRNLNNHANFDLRHRGEDVALYTPIGDLVDGFTFDEQVANVSFGRESDGGVNWVYFQDPTPGGSNITAELPDKDQAGIPQFSHEGGFYTSSFNLTITPPTGTALVTYTLDGTVPTEFSTPATGEIPVDATTIVRARTFDDGVLDSPIVTNSYLLDEGTTLPVISLVTDPDNFFGDYNGIYVVGLNGADGPCADFDANYFQDWQRPLSVEFFEEDGTPGFKFDSEVEIHGSCSRNLPIKALDIQLDYKNGLNQIQYDVFPGYELNIFKSFLLRASGQDQALTMFKDGVAQSLTETRMDIDSQAYRAVAVFINGDYWGIHNIREKLNDDYVKTHHSEEDIDLIQRNRNTIELKEGDFVAFVALESFVRDNDLSNATNYNYVADRVDINSFIDYQIMEIYAASIDWPHNNIRHWRPRVELGKWRWMLFDLDRVFIDPTNDSISRATNPDATHEWSTLFLRKLLENDGFRDEFIQRFAGHLNTTFEEDRVLTFIDIFEHNIAFEMVRHNARWGAPTLADWPNHVEAMRNFVRQRHPYIREHLLSFFTLSGMDNLTVNTGTGGKVLISGVEIPGPVYSGPYFNGVPIRLEAIPDPGYEFLEWQELGNSDPNTSVMFNGELTITAVFEFVGFPPNIVINEIHYNPAGTDDPFEFLELVNNGETAVNLSGFVISQGIVFTFPISTTIDPGEYILLAKLASTYSGSGCQVFQWTSGSLDNGGEDVQLDDQAANMIDYVDYNDEGSWPSTPDDGGPSLALIDLSLDNSLATSWQPSSAIGGTPCAPNVTPDNDEFVNATIIGTIPYATSQFTTGATTAVDDPLPACGAGGQGKGSVWYSFTPAEDGFLTAGTAGSSFNTVLAIWQGSPGSFTPVACDNDSLGLQSELQGVPVDGGTTYYLEITSYSGDLGLLNLDLIFATTFPVTQNISLETGWNSISSYVDPTDPDLKSVLADIESDMVLLKNGDGQVYWWLKYIDTIGEWDVQDGYSIYMKRPRTLTLQGGQVEPQNMPVELLAGWSIISYLRSGPLAVDQALASISSELRLVKNADGGIYWPEFGVDQIGDMQPGEGYQLYMVAPASLVYPTN